MNSEDPDSDPWDSFETYKGPDSELPLWLERALNLFMPVVCLAVVFGVCGTIVWFLPYLVKSGNFMMNEEAWMSWARFLFGGIVGVIVVILGLRKTPLFGPAGESLAEFGERHTLLMVAAIPVLFVFLILAKSHFKAGIMPTDVKDVHGGEIREVIEAEFELPVDPLRGREAVFTEAWSHNEQLGWEIGSHVTIHGVTDAAEQNRIRARIQELVNLRDMPDVKLDFHEALTVDRESKPAKRVIGALIRSERITDQDTSR